jgi:hypothetical protein
MLVSPPITHHHPEIPVVHGYEIRHRAEQGTEPPPGLGWFPVSLLALGQIPLEAVEVFDEEFQGNLMDM